MEVAIKDFLFSLAVIASIIGLIGAAGLIALLLYEALRR